MHATPLKFNGTSPQEQKHTLLPNPRSVTDDICHDQTEQPIEISDDARRSREDAKNDALMTKVTKAVLRERKSLSVDRRSPLITSSFAYISTPK